MIKCKSLICLVLVISVLFLSSCSVAQPEVPETVTEQRSFDFVATDIDGKVVHFSDFQDSKIIMVNFWEPWCIPCVQEMPDIEILYEEYKDDGLTVLGFFSTNGQDEDVKSILEECGTTYPILRCEDPQLEHLQTEYVPTTVFLNPNGEQLTPEPIIGARSYEQWDAIIKEYLQ